jgi:hypothetical protein
MEESARAVQAESLLRNTFPDLNLDVFWKSKSELNYSSDKELRSAKELVLSLSDSTLIEIVKSFSSEQRGHELVSLQVASMSIGRSLEGNAVEQSVAPATSIISVLKLWLQDGTIVRIINSIFEEVATDPLRRGYGAEKKLALDLGFVITSHVFQFSHVSFGFIAPMQTWELEVVLLAMKLLTCFLATHPAYFPYMTPALFEESKVQWPVACEHSCKGKLRTLVHFAAPPPVASYCSALSLDLEVLFSGADSGVLGAGAGAVFQAEAEERGTKKSHAHLSKKAKELPCHNDPFSHLLPWSSLLSTMQLLQLAKAVMATDSAAAAAAATDAAAPPCGGCSSSEVLCVIREVFRRIGTTDKDLLFRGEHASSASSSSPCAVWVSRATRGCVCNICRRTVYSSPFNPDKAFSAFKKRANSNASMDISVISTDSGGVAPAAAAEVLSPVPVVPSVLLVGPSRAAKLDEGKSAHGNAPSRIEAEELDGSCGPAPGPSPGARALARERIGSPAQELPCVPPSLLVDNDAATAAASPESAGSPDPFSDTEMVKSEPPSPVSPAAASAADPRITSSISSSSAQKKQQCCWCFEVVCSTCCAAALWGGDPVCVSCYDVIRHMELEQLVQGGGGGGQSSESSVLRHALTEDIPIPDGSIRLQEDGLLSNNADLELDYCCSESSTSLMNDWIDSCKNR